MIQWLSGCESEAVVFDRYWTLILGLARPISRECARALPRATTVNTRLLDLDSFPSQPLLAWPSPLSQHHYLTAISSVIFQPYTIFLNELNSVSVTNLWISASSKSGSPSGTLRPNMRMFPILSCWLGLFHCPSTTTWQLFLVSSSSHTQYALSIFSSCHNNLHKKCLDSTEHWP